MSDDYMSNYVDRLHALRGGKPDDETTTQQLVVELERGGFLQWARWTSEGKDTYPIIAEMAEADFANNTMTMHAKGPYYARAGKWLLIPLDTWHEPLPPPKPKYGFFARLFGAPPTEGEP